MPQGTVKKVGRLTGGLILVLVLLQPVARLDYGDLYDRVVSLPDGALTQETLAEQTSLPLEAGIEEALSAYIAEKGAALGCPCTARVDCIPDEEGVPIPDRVTVTGTVSPSQKEALQAIIAQDLGVKPENQQYISEETT
jgi:stage III sporulation protein AF